MIASPFRRSVTGRVSIVAHRGLSAEAPENTMAAFGRALEVGCDLLEFDCHLTRDGVVVIIHDDTLDRTTNGHGPVHEHNWKELQGLDAGSWFAPEFAGQWIPRFDELVSWARDTPLVLSIELKQPTPASGLPRYEGLEDRVAQVVRAYGMEQRVLIHSFDHPSVRRMRALLPDVPTGVSYGAGTFVDPLVLGRDALASGIHPWWHSASAQICEAAHAERMHVHAWGAPDPPDADAVAMLVRAGVDSLDANDPRRLRAILERLAAA